MPRLSRNARRNRGYLDWADNLRSEDPFSVAVRPLAQREYETFSQEVAALQGRRDASASDWARVLGAVCEGPFTREPLYVDEAFVAQGDLEALLRATGAHEEATELRGNLVAELVFYVAGTVQLNRRTAGESERLLGGGGTSQTPSTPSGG